MKNDPYRTQAEKIPDMKQPKRITEDEDKLALLEYLFTNIIALILFVCFVVSFAQVGDSLSIGSNAWGPRFLSACSFCSLVFFLIWARRAKNVMAQYSAQCEEDRRNNRHNT